MKKELEKINTRLGTIEENTDFNFTYGHLALWILILFAMFGGALYFIYN